MAKLYRVKFVWDFLRRNKVDACFKSIFYNDKLLTENHVANSKLPKIIYINLFPTYLKHEISNSNAYHLKRIKQVNIDGAGIAFNEKIKLKKIIDRLDKSFNIAYEYNYGEITNEKCDFLLNALYNMLKRRFDEKQVINSYFSIWEDLTKDLFSLINQKKASLFVAYDNDKPISISLNYHISDTIMHSEINAFDIDYSKFGLGHLGNKLLINWCINNKYAFLDLGNGVINYKLHICNTFYNFEYLIYYKKNSITAWSQMFKELGVIHFKNTLKSINTEFQNKISKLNKKKDTSAFQIPSYKIEQVNEIQLIDTSKLILIDINEDTNALLRKPVYDYLYTNHLHINAIFIYKILSEQNSFLIKSTDSVKLILL